MQTTLFFFTVLSKISCTINHEKKFELNDTKYKNYNIYECLNKNDYLNNLEKKIENVKNKTKKK